jgi:hypothetical protein
MVTVLVMMTTTTIATQIVTKTRTMRVIPAATGHVTRYPQVPTTAKQLHVHSTSTIRLGTANAKVSA